MRTTRRHTDPEVARLRGASGFGDGGRARPARLSSSAIHHVGVPAFAAGEPCDRYGVL